MSYQRLHHQVHGAGIMSVGQVLVMDLYSEVESVEGYVCWWSGCAAGEKQKQRSMMTTGDLDGAPEGMVVPFSEMRRASWEWVRPSCKHGMARVLFWAW